MKRQSLFSAENKKNITSWSSAEFAHRVVKIKIGTLLLSFYRTFRRMVSNHGLRQIIFVSYLP